MSTKTFEQMIQEFEQDDAYWTELAIIEFTETIVARMQAQNVTRTELASRIGKSKSYVTKVLQGDNNFTISTMVSLIRALDGQLQVGERSAKVPTPVWQARRVATYIPPSANVGEAWDNRVKIVASAPTVSIVKEENTNDEKALSAA